MLHLAKCVLKYVLILLKKICIWKWKEDRVLLPFHAWFESEMAHFHAFSHTFQTMKKWWNGKTTCISQTVPKVRRSTAGTYFHATSSAPLYGWKSSHYAHRHNMQKMASVAQI